MAEAGVYLCVVRQDGPLPVVVHSSIRRNDEEGRTETYALAWELFQSARARIPFTVAEIHLSPVVTEANTPNAGLEAWADRYMEERGIEPTPEGQTLADRVARGEA